MAVRDEGVAGDEEPDDAAAEHGEREREAELVGRAEPSDATLRDGR